MTYLHMIYTKYYLLKTTINLKINLLIISDEKETNSEYSPPLHFAVDII